MYIEIVLLGIKIIGDEKGSCPKHGFNVAGWAFLIKIKHRENNVDKGVWECS